MALTDALGRIITARQPGEPSVTYDAARKKWVTVYPGGRTVVTAKRPSFDVQRAAGKTNPGGFTPWDPGQKPPSGTYDPTLDANLRGAQRGYGDLTLDTETQNTRALNDYGIAQHQIQSGLASALASNEIAQNRLKEDTARATQNLGRQYQQQGQGQAQAAQAAGAVGGGALAQALLKRTANQARDQQGIDQGAQRGLSDLMRSADQARYAANDQMGALKLAYDRGVQDRGTTLTRAGRELTAFGTDTAEQRAFQAGQAGWQNAAPSNEFRTAAGNPYRVIQSKDWLVGPGGKRTRKIYLLPNGQRTLTRPT